MKKSLSDGKCPVRRNPVRRSTRKSTPLSDKTNVSRTFATSDLIGAVPSSLSPVETSESKGGELSTKEKTSTECAESAVANASNYAEKRKEPHHSATCADEKRITGNLQVPYSPTDGNEHKNERKPAHIKGNNTGHRTVAPEIFFGKKKSVALTNHSSDVKLRCKSNADFQGPSENNVSKTKAQISPGPVYKNCTLSTNTDSSQVYSFGESSDEEIAPPKNKRNSRKAKVLKKTSKKRSLHNDPQGVPQMKTTVKDYTNAKTSFAGLSGVQLKTPIANVLNTPLVSGKSPNGMINPSIPGPSVLQSKQISEAHLASEQKKSAQALTTPVHSGSIVPSSLLEMSNEHPNQLFHLPSVSNYASHPREASTQVIVRHEENHPRHNLKGAGSKSQSAGTSPNLHVNFPLSSMKRSQNRQTSTESPQLEVCPSRNFSKESSELPRRTYPGTRGCKVITCHNHINHSKENGSSEFHDASESGMSGSHEDIPRNGELTPPHKSTIGEGSQRAPLAHTTLKKLGMRSYKILGVRESACGLTSSECLSYTLDNAFGFDYDGHQQETLVENPTRTIVSNSQQHRKFHPLTQKPSFNEVHASMIGQKSKPSDPQNSDARCHTVQTKLTDFISFSSPSMGLSARVKKSPSPLTSTPQSLFGEDSLERELSSHFLQPQHRASRRITRQRNVTSGDEEMPEGPSNSSKGKQKRMKTACKEGGKKKTDEDELMDQWANNVSSHFSDVEDIELLME